MDDDVKEIVECMVTMIEAEERRMIDQEIIRVTVQNSILSGAVELIGGVYCFFCPHCHGPTQILNNQVNCRIFRHAVYVSNNIPINPHMSKNQCEELVEKGLVRGCAKPFEFISCNNGYKVQVCEYK